MVVLLRPIDELLLTREASQFLKANDIFYVGDLAQRGRKELLQLPGANAAKVLDIDLALRRNGIVLGARPDHWPPTRKSQA